MCHDMAGTTGTRGIIGNDCCAGSISAMVSSFLINTSKSLEKEKKEIIVFFKLSAIASRLYRFIILKAEQVTTAVVSVIAGSYTNRHFFDNI
jgi:hypothetical protein